MNTTIVRANASVFDRIGAFFAYLNDNRRRYSVYRQTLRELEGLSDRVIGLLGVPHGELPVDSLFWRNVGLRGGPAPVRAYLPHLLDLVWSRQINPGRVFDLELPLAEVAEAYRAMDERRAIKALLRP